MKYPTELLFVTTLCGCILADRKGFAGENTGANFPRTAGTGAPIKIGMTLYHDSPDQIFLEKALLFTLREINSMQQAIRFEMSFNYIELGDVIGAYRSLCQMVSEGITIQILPREAPTASLFQLACDRLDLACLDIFHRDRARMSAKTFSVQIDIESLGKAVVDVMQHYQLNRTAAIVHDTIDVPRLDTLFFYGRQRNISVEIFYKNSTTYRPVLKRLRMERVFTFLVTIQDNEIPQFIQNVLQLNMHDSLYTYVFMGLNLLLEDLTDISQIGIKFFAFTSINIANQVNPLKMSEMVAFAELGKVKLNTNRLQKRTVAVPLEAAALYDTLHLLARAMENFVPLSPEFFTPVSCTASSRWPYGSTILNYLNTVSSDGLTGKINMQSAGRDEHILHLLELRETGLSKVGTWSTKTGLTVQSRSDAAVAKPVKTSSGTEDDPLIIVSILQEPFLMLRDEIRRDMSIKNETFPDNLVNEQHLQGFVIDLLDAINTNMQKNDEPGFKYKIYLVPDGEFGDFNEETGKWNGLVKEILNGNATLAVAPFTLTAKREAYISFTKPFMTAGIGILYQAPRGSAPNLFALMRSLSAELWVASLGATAVIGFSMWVIAQFSPLEWDNRHLCTGVPMRFAVNSFNLRNSLWFAMCTLLMQGCDINPRAVSTRLLGGVWWFYTLFLSAHFVAKLASVLTVEKMSVPFSSVDELVKHPEITYGMKIDGATFNFFKESTIPMYHDMFENMNQSSLPVLVASDEEGIRRVMNDKYAFLMESHEIEYLVQRNCNVTQIGGTLNIIQYGIGTVKNSPWVEKLSMNILDLIEKSTIAALQQQWWQRGSICASKDEKSTGPSAINSTLVGGAFLILAVGLVAAVTFAGLEFIWNAVQNAKIDKKSLWTELVLELRHALRFRASSTRPVLQNRCLTCGVETHSLAAAQMHEHKDYTPMLFLDSTFKKQGPRSILRKKSNY